MENTVNQVAEPKTVKAKKGVKEKLKEWYINQVRNPKETDKIRAVFSTFNDIQNAVGAAAVAIFAPEALPAVPIAQKISKGVQMGMYDGGKVIGAKIAGVEVEPDNTQGKSLLDDKQVNQIGSDAKELFTMIKKDQDAKKPIVDQGGKTL